MSNPHDAAKAIQQQLGKSFKPQLGLVLGSGLGVIAEQISDATVIPYSAIPGFPQKCGVLGHKGQLVLGTLAGLPVVCLQGRAHCYEGTTNDVIKCIVRTFKLLGCDKLFITNAAGSINPHITAGNISLITDHINFSLGSPLMGLNDEEFGERFHAMENAYDAELSGKFLALAKQMNIPLSSGVYVGVMGPHFETPAEIKAFRIMGGDLVGMSTIPEVIVARHCGLKVIAVSAIVNLAAGMNAEPINHAETLHFGGIAAKNLEKLIMAFAEQLAHGR